MNQERYEYEVGSQLWYWEEKYKSGTDYFLKDNPEYIEWLEEKRKRDILYQMRDTHQT